MDPERIILELDSTKVASGMGGLSALVKQLETVERGIRSVNSALANMEVIGKGRGFNELQSAIRGLQAKGGGLKVGEVAKGLSLDEAQFEKFLARRKSSIAGYKSTMKEFESANKAAHAVQLFERERASTARSGGLGLEKILTPTVAQVQSNLTGNISGTIPISIPGAQVQASVVGPVILTIPGSQITATGGGAGAGGSPRNPATGAFVPGGGGGGGRKKKSGKAELNIPAGGNEITRVRTETEDYLREVITAAEDLGKTVSKTYDSVEGVIKTVSKTDSGSAMLKSIQQRKKLAEIGFAGEKAKLQPQDFAGLSKLQNSQASALEKILTAELRAALGDKKYDFVEKRIEAEANTLRAKAGANAGRAVTQRRAFFQKQVDDNFRKRKEKEEEELRASVELATRNNKASKIRRTRAEEREEEKRLADVEAATRRNRTRELLRGRHDERTAPVIPPPVIPPAPKPSRFQQAVSSFSPVGFGLNLIKVAGWASAVAVLYKSIELVNYSLGRMIAIGAQTARLSQIFHGVGGSAQELTEDTLNLASAMGRSTDEAMESAIAWSRLGLTRRQVNEAVRQSLIAANVADVDAATATRYLSSIMKVYNLEVRDLSGVLGMLNNTSNKWNVTNQDLFDGIARVAAVAKQAGVPLAELQGLIGAAVGQTGQTGSNIGNALKSVIVSLSNPDIQSYLREGLNIETTGGKDGEMKSMSQVFRDMALAYAGLNDEERKNLTVRVAGKTQASRFVAILESYVDAQKLAIDSQLNLNSAEQENSKILGSQKAQLQGIKSAWDALVTKQSNTPLLAMGGKTLNEQLVTAERTVKNVIRLINSVPSLGLPHGAPDDILDKLREGKMGSLKKMFQGGLFSVNTLDMFNYAMESGDERGGRQMNKMSEDEQRSRKAAAAFDQRARLFRTVAEAMGKGRPEENQRNVKDLMPGQQGQQLEQLVRTGQLLQAQVVLRQAALSADKESIAAAKDAVGKKSEAIGLLQRQKTVQEGLLKREQDGTQSQIEAKQRLRDTEAQISEMMGQRANFMAELDEMESGDFEGRSQRVVDLLEKERTISQSLGQLWEQMPVDTVTGKLDAQVAILREQERLIGEMITQLEKGVKTPARIGEIQKKESEQRDIRGQIGALNAPENRALAGLADNRAVAFRQAGLEAQGFGVGRTEAEKILTRERELQKQLKELREQGGKRPLTDNERARQLQFENELTHTQEQIQERILFLRAQQKQIVADTNREFQKSLLFASPSEMLRKLAVTQLGQKGGMNAGNFFAMDPESRRIFDMLRGGDAGRANREEMGLLGRRQLPLDAQQQDRRYGTAQSAAAAAALGASQNGVREGFRPAQGLIDISTHAKTAAVGLAAVGTQASVTSAQLGGLGETLVAVIGWVKSEIAVVKQTVLQNLPRRGGMSAGHALGGS